MQMNKAILAMVLLTLVALVGGCLRIEARAPERIVVPSPSREGPPPPPPEHAPRPGEHAPPPGHAPGAHAPAPPPGHAPAPPARGELLPIVGYDTLAYVREPVQLALWQPNIVQGTEVVFNHRQWILGRTRFDANGWARVSFAPQAAGIFVVTARTLTGQPGEGILIMSALPKQAPLVVVDLDHAIVASRAKRQWLGQSKAVTGAAAALAAIGQKHPVVYSTNYSDELSQATRNWLNEAGFPVGPILLAQSTADPFKSAAPGVLTNRFPQTCAAVMHKVEEAEAWAARGVPTYLLLKIDEDDYKDLRKAARDLRRLPRGISPVTSWNQIQDALLRGVQFSPRAVAEQLERQADYWERKKKKDD